MGLAFQHCRVFLSSKSVSCFTLRRHPVKWPSRNHQFWLWLNMFNHVLNHVKQSHLTICGLFLFNHSWLMTWYSYLWLLNHFVIWKNEPKNFVGLVDLAVCHQQWDWPTGLAICCSCKILQLISSDSVSNYFNRMDLMTIAYYCSPEESSLPEGWLTWICWPGFGLCDFRQIEGMDILLRKTPSPRLHGLELLETMNFSRNT